MIKLKILDSGDIQFSVTNMEEFMDSYIADEPYGQREWLLLEPLCRDEGFNFHPSGEELNMLYSGPVIVDKETDRLWYDNYYAIRDAVDELLQGRSVVYTLYRD
jgi:hypothetical protein